ncbi:unnamed protein product [Parajaminaea phylloscopi]
MAPTTGTSNDVLALIASNSTSANIAKAVAIAAVTSGVTYWATRPAKSTKTDSSSSKDRKGAKQEQQQQKQQQPQPAADEVFQRVRFEDSMIKSNKPIPVAVFWDVDNCAPPSGSSGRQIVLSIRKHLSSISVGSGPDQEELGPSGPLMSFKAYLELSSAEGVGPAQVNLRSELQGSGVSLIDTPKSGRKDVADKMIIADIMAFALDVAPPARIVLISGDRDFAYPLSLIRGRGYQVVLITPPVGAVPILKASASHVARWRQDVLGMDRDGFGRPYEHSTPTKALPRSSSPGPNKASASTAPRPVTPGPAQTPATNGTPQQESSQSARTEPKPAKEPAPALTGPGAPPVPSVFGPLVQALTELKKEGHQRPLRSLTALRLTSIEKDVYERAGAASWRDYIAVAEAAGIIILGSAGKPGSEWIALRTLDSFPAALPKAAATPSTPAAATGIKSVPSAKDAVTSATNAVAETASSAGQRQVDESASKDFTDSDLDAMDDSDDDLLAPPSLFKPFVVAMHRAERRTQRYPPLAHDVNSDLQSLIASGRVECPPPMQGPGKSFGAYITSAYKYRVAKLTPSELHGSAALEISPAYSAWYDKLRARHNKKSKPGQMVQETVKSSPMKKELSNDVTKKVGDVFDGAAGVYKAPFLRGMPEPTSGASAEDWRAVNNTSSARPSFFTPNGKKSAYDAGHEIYLAHQPSGTKISVAFFPLANALLFQRREGQTYSTEKVLHIVVSKHKHLGSHFKDPEVFHQYILRAEREGIITMEPGLKEGTRHIVLAPKLRDPNETSASGRDKKGEEVRLHDGNDTSPPSSTKSDSPRLERRLAAPSSSESDPFKVTTSNRRTPTVEDRTRFKPLMDVLIALRKRSVLRPRGDQFVSALESRQAGSEGWKNAEAKSAWLDSHEAEDELDYCVQAQQFGFVTVKMTDEGWSVRLSDKYEALISVPGTPTAK